MYKHILIPCDGSKPATRAAEAAVRLAKAVGARVTGLFVAPVPTPIVYKGLLPVDYATPQEHAQMIERAAKKVLAVVERAAAKEGVTCETMRVMSDFPAEAIIAAATKRRCDLIFMAPHGRRGALTRLLLGSQTQKVLALATIPVLVQR
jgi:nucleotide-binding universal stress UspA family protein